MVGVDHRTSAESKDHICRTLREAIANIQFCFWTSYKVTHKLIISSLRVLEARTFLLQLPEILFLKFESQ